MISLLDHLFNESLLFRTGRKLRALYRQCLMCRIINTIKRSASKSFLARIVDFCLNKDPLATKTSVYSRFMSRLHHGVSCAGSVWLPVMRKSAASRCFSAVGNAFRPVVNSSLVLRPLRLAGLRRLLIIAFTLYLPIDFFFRSIVQIDVFSAIWDEAFFLLVMLFIIWRRFSGRAPTHGYTTPLDSPILLFIAVGFFLMCTVCPDFSIAVAGFRAIFEYIFWFFALIRLFEDDGDVLYFYHAMSLFGLLLALYGIYQYVTGVEMPSGWTTASELGVRTRVFGLTTSPNIMGSLMIMVGPLCASYAYTAKSIVKKVLALCATGAVCLALLFTFSRGAWLGMAVAVLVFSILVDRRLIALMLAAIPPLLMVPEIANRITYLFTSDFSAANQAGGRAMRWAFGESLFFQNIISGFGLGRFGGAVAMQNQTLDGINNFTYFYLDNYYLKTAVETGLLGIIAFAVALIAIIVIGLRAVRRAGRGSSMSIRTAALLSSMCGIMMHLYTENIFEVPYMNAYFWGFAAVIAYIGFIRPKCNESSRSI